MVLDGQWYRLALGPFAHASLLHLWLNLYGMYYLLMKLESDKIQIKIMIISTFSLSILISALMFGLFGFSETSVGLSGGVLSIVGFLFSYRKTEEIVNITVLVFISGSLFPGFIDNVSHACGFLSGFIIGWLYLRLTKVRDKQCKAI